MPPRVPVKYGLPLCRSLNTLSEVSISLNLLWCESFPFFATSNLSLCHPKLTSLFPVPDVEERDSRMCASGRYILVSCGLRRRERTPGAQGARVYLNGLIDRWGEAERCKYRAEWMSGAGNWIGKVGASVIRGSIDF